MKYLILAGLFVIGVSCSSSDKPSAFLPTDSGGSAGAHSGGSSGRNSTSGGGRGGSAALGGEGGESGGGEMVSPLAPQLSITNPVEANDPNVDPVLIGDQITVVCTAKTSTVSGAKPANSSSVQIAMLDAKGMSLKSLAGAPTGNVDEYSAPFVLTAVPSGAVSFQCTADDTATPVNHSTATIRTFVDRGPDIAVTAPVKDSAHNLLGPVDVEFTLSAAPVAASDKQADVSGVTLQVGGVAITTTNKGGGAYQASVDFSDKKLFPSPPSGPIPVVIAAANERKAPGKAVHTLTYTFVLDGVGPVVTFTSPPEGAVVGRASTLAFTVVDMGSGVDNPTVEVRLNGVSHMFSTTDGLWTLDDATGAYTFKMGTQLASDSTDSQVTVDVNVQDKAGNASTGNSRVLQLDTQPPIVDMDPPNMYVTRPGTAPGILQCSDFFDPVGANAPSDLSTITNYGFFRALVWDQANSNFGQQIFTFALTDKTSVRLYVQPDTTKPLLRHESGPGNVCNEIWTGSPPEQKNPDDKPLQFVALSPLAAIGATNWGVSANPPTDTQCQAGPVTASPTLCNGNSLDMSLVIHHPVVTEPREPVIYAFQPATDPMSPKCAGDQWALSTALTSTGTTKLGWVCAAVRALDTVGNPGVSGPLRLCLDDGSNPHRCDGIPPPSCTDNCTPPAHFAVPPDSQN